ncbi:hypothetical protein F6476_04270 [Pseudomonas umsongensis]|nr:hypothetical protein F6476_04270 [Pseudomonas umsongensis]
MLIASQSSRAGSHRGMHCYLQALQDSVTVRTCRACAASAPSPTTAPVGGAYAMTLSGFVHQLTAAAIGAMI